MDKDLSEMTDLEYTEWFANSGSELIDLNYPSEENLINLFSAAVRTISVEERAQSLVDVANMCLALADKTLGAQSVVATCIVLNKH